jgi:signal transduction histidine kinase
MKKFVVIPLTLMVCLCFAGIALADSATKDEVVAKCEDAAKLVQDKGIDQAKMAIGNKSGPFVWKDTYVFMMNMDGKMLAHPIKPELAERDNLLNVKDTAGKPLFVEFVDVANSKGKGWVTYMWPKPGEEKSSPKNTYILRVPGTQYFVGAGIYE